MDLIESLYFERIMRMKFFTAAVLVILSMLMSGCAFSISPLMFLLIRNDTPSEIVPENPIESASSYDIMAV